MKKKEFFTGKKPPLVAMVQDPTPSEMICTITKGLYEGADAFGIQLECLEKEYRDLATLKNIFAACADRPIYLTAYPSHYSSDLTQEECAALLLMGLEAGATLIDVRGDQFHPEPHELTYDASAVEKQKKLIDEIHAGGGQVLMSSHTHIHLDADTVVAYAKEQEARGADVIKIVNFCNSEEEERESFEMIYRLTKEISHPFLFLVNGKYHKRIRQLGIQLGVSMALCVVDYKPFSSKEQPLLRAMRVAADHLVMQ